MTTYRQEMKGGHEMIAVASSCNLREIGRLKQEDSNFKTDLSHSETLSQNTKQHGKRLMMVHRN